MNDTAIPVQYRVASRRQDTRDTFTLGLKPDGPGTGRETGPGQFNMVYVFGVGEAPLSIGGRPEDDGLLRHTVRAVGPVTDALRDLGEGGVVGIRGPFGTRWPLEEARGGDVVIVAGGVGLAPLRPAIQGILAGRAHYGRLCIYYGARSPDDILFRDELVDWARREDVTVEVTVDRATGAWSGKVGVVTTLIGQGGFEPRDATAFVCGPEVMMRYATLKLLEGGVAPSNVYLSMERNMKCATGHCGHCQLGPFLICRDGPVFSYATMAPYLDIPEL